MRNNIDEYILFVIIMFAVFALIILNACSGASKILPNVKELNRDLKDTPHSFTVPEYNIRVATEPSFKLNEPFAAGIIKRKLDKYCTCIKEKWNNSCDMLDHINSKMIIIDTWKFYDKEMNMTIAGLRWGKYIYIAWGSNYIIPHEYDHLLGYLPGDHSNLSIREKCYFE